jgi:hypothetical protein
MQEVKTTSKKTTTKRKKSSKTHRFSCKLNGSIRLLCLLIMEIQLTKKYLIQIEVFFLLVYIQVT